MIRHLISLLAIHSAVLATGCTSCPAVLNGDSPEGSCDSGACLSSTVWQKLRCGNGADDAPGTIFTWAIGPKEPDKGGNAGKGHGSEKNGGNGDQNGAQAGNGGNARPDRPLDTDRPDFTEASTTVGRGRVVLEGGYTYIHDQEKGMREDVHSYPETLLRVGLFRDWFELRMGWNYFIQTTTEGGIVSTRSGADDLYLGTKLQLTEQKQYLPESALILRLTVPTGAQAFSAGEVHPGFNLCLGWDIVEDFLKIGTSSQMYRASGVAHACFPSFDVHLANPVVGQDAYLGLAQSLTINYELNKRLTTFTEGFALFPHSSVDPDIGPEYYFDAGGKYLVTANLQFDLRAGVGLNKHAQDFFTGAGFAVRY